MSMALGRRQSAGRASRESRLFLFFYPSILFFYRAHVVSLSRRGRLFTVHDMASGDGWLT